MFRMTMVLLISCLLSVVSHAAVQKDMTRKSHCVEWRAEDGLYYRACSLRTTAYLCGYPDNVNYQAIFIDELKKYDISPTTVTLVGVDHGTMDLLCEDVTLYLYYIVNGTGYMKLDMNE